MSFLRTEDIVARLDIVAEYRALGFRIEREPSADKVECFSRDRDEKNPSAVIFLKTGRYHDSGGDGKGMSLFDSAVKYGSRGFKDWREARDYYAAQAGLKVEKRPHAKPEKGLALDQLEWLPDKMTAPFCRLWIIRKPGCTIEGAIAAGARAAKWVGKFDVIAFPGFLPASDVPAAFVLYRANGELFPETGSLGERKTHLLRGSTPSLIVVGGMAALHNAAGVLVCEGATDAIAGSTIAPAGVVAVTGTHGANAAFTEDMAMPLAGKQVLFVYDDDVAGATGCLASAKVVANHACQVRSIHPPQNRENGKDLRDFVFGGGTFDELKRLAGTATDEASDAAVLFERARIGDFGFAVKDKNITNQQTVPITEEGKEPTAIPIEMKPLKRMVFGRFAGFPACCEDSLFIPNLHGGIDYLDTPTKLFAWLANFGTVWWKERREGFVSKAELFEELKRDAVRRYEAVELYPHYPPIEGRFYRNHIDTIGDGSAFEGLLDFLRPATPLDRHLMAASLMTPFWGGPPGKRPVTVVTSPDGQGSGKTTIAIIAGKLYGGKFELDPEESIDRIKARLLTRESMGKRIAVLDNIREDSFGWPQFESFVTTDSISGHRLNAGERDRANYLSWFITLNSPKFGKDVCQRSVIIEVLKPNYDGKWDEAVDNYIRSKRFQIFADMQAILRRPPNPITVSVSRWGRWAIDVLARLPNPDDLLRLIAERQSAADGDRETTEALESFLLRKVRQLGYSSDDSVFIPSAIAAQWYSEFAGRRYSIISGPRKLNEEIRRGLACLSRKKVDDDRGYVWSLRATTLAPATDLIRRMEEDELRRAAERARVEEESRQAIGGYASRF